MATISCLAAVAGLSQLWSRDGRNQGRVAETLRLGMGHPGKLALDDKASRVKRCRKLGRALRYVENSRSRGVLKRQLEEANRNRRSPGDYWSTLCSGPAASDQRIS